MAGNLKGKHGTTAAESITREDYILRYLYFAKIQQKFLHDCPIQLSKAVNNKKIGLISNTKMLKIWL
jgi:hypothetical protein